MSQRFFLDNSTSYHIIAFVEYGRLPGSNTIDCMGELNMNAVRHIGKYAFGTSVTIADLSRGLHTIGYLIIFHHIEATDYHFALLQLVSLAKDNGIGFR